MTLWFVSIGKLAAARFLGEVKGSPPASAESQRLIDVPFVLPAAPNQLNATIPSGADRNVATPGWYMLFLTDKNNVPSAARWVHLS
jgi:hypothetical protein